MRGVVLSMVLAACVTTAGCHRSPAAETQRVRDGVAAFRVGDRERLTDLLQRARDYERDRDPCSTRAWAEARREAAVALLAPLDRDDLFAVSEEARFAYLARTARRGRLAELPRPLGCDGVSRGAARRDFEQRQAMLTAYGDAAALWRRDLEARYGETEMRQRLVAAGDTLRVNRVGRTRLSRLDDRRPLRRLAALDR